MAENTFKIPFLGFEIKKTEKPKDESKLKAVVPKTDEDGAGYVTASGSHFATYVDLDNTSKDNRILINQYRTVAQHPEVDTAIEHIVNEAISASELESSVEINLDKVETSKKIKESVIEEFDNICSLLNFNELGHDIFRSWYVDGRLVHQLIVDEKQTKKGIQDIRMVDASKIKKVKEVEYGKDEKTGAKIVKKVDEFFIYQPKASNKPGYSSDGDSKGVKISEDAISYVTSGLLDPSRKKVISYLHKALKPTNQLRMMEDSLVIYRLARAPERRIFYIDTGNLTTKKAEAYMKQIMNKYRNKLVYDANTGEVKDDRKHMAMLEDFWLPRREGSQGTQIDTLSGGENLGQIEDIIFFQKKVYKSLNVPVNRLEQEAPFSLGRSTEITRDEVTFQKFIDRLRKRFAHLFLGILKKQLLLKGIITEEDWEKWKNDVSIDFVRDNHFTEMKDTELLRERLTTLDQVSQYVGEFFSREWTMKNIMRFSDEDIKKMQKEVENENSVADDDTETGSVVGPSSTPDPVDGQIQ